MGILEKAVQAVKGPTEAADTKNLNKLSMPPTKGAEQEKPGKIAQPEAPKYVVSEKETRIIMAAAKVLEKQVRDDVHAEPGKAVLETIADFRKAVESRDMEQSLLKVHHVLCHLQSLKDKDYNPKYDWAFGTKAKDRMEKMGAVFSKLQGQYLEALREPEKK